MSYKEKLKNISTFIFDVDGVLTNGEVLVDGDRLLRSLNSKDGYAFQYASKMGYSIFAITGGNAADVKEKLIHLGFKYVFLKSSNKLQVYTDLKETFQIQDDEVLYMGDDIPDIQVMKAVHVSTCPQDAVSEVKSIASYQSPYLGGTGCARDVIEQTLKVQGKWLNDGAYTW